MADNRNNFSVINVKGLAKLSKIPYAKLRNCIVGEYASLSDAERAKLFNVLQSEVTKSCAWLGFSYEGRPIKLKD